MREKAFILTADALFALTAIGLLATAYAVLGSAKPQAAKYAALEQQGRDYLNLAYREGFDNFTAENFSQLTKHNCSGGCLGEKKWEFTNAGDASDWNAVAGTWAIDAVTGTFEATDPDATGWITQTGRQNWGNYNVSARFFSIEETMLMIGFHADANGSRYTCRYDATAGIEDLSIWKKANWEEAVNPMPTTLKNSINLNPVQNGDWHTLSASIKDGNIACSIDNDQLVTYYDPAPLRNGWITLETLIIEDSEPAAFDNVSVLNVAQDPPYGANFSMRSVLVDYPWRCGCAPWVEFCNVSRGSGCLGGQDYNQSSYNEIYREAWVS